MPTTRLFLHPAVERQEIFDDLASRLAWYFGPVRDRLDAIHIALGRDVEAAAIPPDTFDPTVTTWVQAVRGLIKPSPASGADALLEDMDPERDLLLRWTVAEPPSGDMAAAINRMRANGRFYEIDAGATRMEGSFLLWAVANNLMDSGPVLEQSRQRLKAFVDQLPQRDVAYVFGTGPSLSGYVASRDFSDGLCIASNSMVKNRELLEALKPVAIVAGDPLFHAGVSRYAAEFRRNLVRALETTGAMFFAPLRDYHIHAANLPEHLRDRLIALPFDAKQPYNPDLTEALYVNPKANVLTLFLLPLASTLAQEVRIVGCDGRPLAQDQYFWKHDKAAQFNNEMDNIQRVHPAFFVRDYNDYYIEHCETVESSVRALEAAGRTVRAMTPSYVPALAERYSDPLAGDDRVAEVISLDPDALDNFGHFLSYDGRLREAAERQALEFSVFGNQAFDDSRCEGWESLDRIFSRHSWTVGNRPAGPAQDDVDAFEAELRRGFDERRQRGLTRRTAVYMYCGSLPHLEVILKIADEFEELKFNVNLFWTSFVPYRKPSYVERWKPVLERALAHPRVAVTSPTERLSNGIHRAFSLDIPVAPHPSTTFFDDAVASIPPPPPIRERPRVLFPGGMRAEKGFGLTCKVVASLAARGDALECIVRAYQAGNTPKAMLEARDRLAGLPIELVTQDMDDREFAEFMREADLVVLPYQNPDFRERTSGLLIDAMLLGRPAVVLENTWLADVVEAGGFGVVARNTPEDIERAVMEALSRHAELTEAARHYRTGYMRTESWGRLLDQIVGSPPRVRRRRLAAAPTGIVLVGGEGAVDVDLPPNTPIMAVSDGYRRLQAMGVESDYYVNLAADANTVATIAGEFNDLVGRRHDSRMRRMMVRSNVVLAVPGMSVSPLVISFDGMRNAAPVMAEGPISTLDQAVRWAAAMGYKDVYLSGVRQPESDRAAAWQRTREHLSAQGVKIHDAGQSS